MGEVNILFEMRKLLDTVDNGVIQLNKEFDISEYEYRVDADVYKQLIEMLEDDENIYVGSSIYNYESITAFSIKVICSPLTRGIKLMHCIGGIEL